MTYVATTCHLTFYFKPLRSISIGHFDAIRPEMCGLISTKISIAMLCGFQPLLASIFQVNNLQRVHRALKVVLEQVVRQDPPWRLPRWRLVGVGRRDHEGDIDHVGVSLREKVFFYIKIFC